MSLPVFRTASLAGERLSLSGPEGRHAVTVRRIRPGEQVVLIDGSGEAATILVEEVSGGDTMHGTVVERHAWQPPRPYVVVVQALPKSERSELAVDLATQAGADEIIPWQAARCEAKWVGAKIDRQVAKWEAAALAAAKQSRRTRVPPIHRPVSTRQLAELIADQTAYVLHEDAAQPITEADLDVEKLYLLVGPEGGIGAEELDLLGAQALRLGPEVYRTASAAMVALSAIGALRRW